MSITLNILRKVTLFFYKRDGINITLVLVYIDDMIVTSNNTDVKLRSYLAKEFEMKDLGNLNNFLGIEVS